MRPAYPLTRAALGLNRLKLVPAANQDRDRHWRWEPVVETVVIVGGIKHQDTVRLTHFLRPRAAHEARRKAQALDGEAGRYQPAQLTDGEPIAIVPIGANRVPRILAGQIGPVGQRVDLVLHALRDATPTLGKRIHGLPPHSGA